MKNVYFLSDAHLGSRAIEHGRTQERRLVNFLDSIKHKAAAVYLLGDMFDFWYEFRTVVPKGYTRFLGKLSELTDMGVEVHFFTGNHDIWSGITLRGVRGSHSPRTPHHGNLRKRVLPCPWRRIGDPDKNSTAAYHVSQPYPPNAVLHPPPPLERRVRTEVGKSTAVLKKESRRGKEAPTTWDEKQRASCTVYQRVSEEPSEYKLLHLRPSAHRTGFDAECHRPRPYPRRLDKLFLLCRIRRREPVSGRVYRRGNQTVNHLPRLSKTVYSYKRLRKRTKSRNFLPGCL